LAEAPALGFLILGPWVRIPPGMPILRSRAPPGDHTDGTFIVCAACLRPGAGNGIRRFEGMANLAMI